MTNNLQPMGIEPNEAKQLIPEETCGPKTVCSVCDPEMNWVKSTIDLNQFTDISNFKPYTTDLIVMPLTTDANTETSSAPNAADNNIEVTQAHSIKWVLERIHDSGSNEIHELADNSCNLVGHNKLAHINTPSIYCSKKHCIIRVMGETVLIEDTKVLFP